MSGAIAAMAAGRGSTADARAKRLRRRGGRARAGAAGAWRSSSARPRRAHPADRLLRPGLRGRRAAGAAAGAAGARRGVRRAAGACDRRVACARGCDIALMEVAGAPHHPAPWWKHHERRPAAPGRAAPRRCTTTAPRCTCCSPTASGGRPTCWSAPTASALACGSWRGGRARLRCGHSVTCRIAWVSEDAELHRDLAGRSACSSSSIGSSWSRPLGDTGVTGFAVLRGVAPPTRERRSGGWCRRRQCAASGEPYVDAVAQTVVEPWVRGRVLLGDACAAVCWPAGASLAIAGAERLAEELAFARHAGDVVAGLERARLAPRHRARAGARPARAGFRAAHPAGARDPAHGGRRPCPASRSWWREPPAVWPSALRPRRTARPRPGPPLRGTRGTAPAGGERRLGPRRPAGPRRG